jgi:hypothetical protein
LLDVSETTMSNETRLSSSLLKELVGARQIESDSPFFAKVDAGSSSPIPGSSSEPVVESNRQPELSLSDDDQTLYEESNPYKSHKVTIEDWSGTGRGSHVDFEKQETISLQQGKFGTWVHFASLMAIAKVVGLVEALPEMCMRLPCRAVKLPINDCSLIVSTWTKLSARSIS